MKRLLDTEVRYFDQDSFNIPKLENRWGCMVDFLDHTLVHNGAEIGINFIKTTEEVDYWVCSIETSMPHSLKSLLSVIDISGSEELTYNNTFRVQEVLSPNTFTIAFSKESLPLKPPDISQENMFLKISSLGFEKTHSEYQKAVYKTTTKKDLECFLRVDNSCPEGHDPSWAKFSRVSMFSEIDTIDDYEFRLDRTKAPVISSNYVKSEESSEEVWINCRQSVSSNYFYKDRTENADLPEFFIIGTKNTFYIFLRAVLITSPYTDVIYTFGEYNKLMYKEDTLPFLLKTSSESPSGRYLTGSEFEDLFRQSSSGKHTFTSDISDNFTSTNSVKWSLFFNESYLSGITTDINYRTYKNELVLNLFPAYIKIHRPGRTLLEGILKGVSLIMADMRDTPEYSLDHLQTFLHEGRHYLTVRSRDRNQSDLKVLIHLNDWE